VSTRGRLAALSAALLTACAAQPKPPAATPQKSELQRDVFLFLGDSLTAGYGVAPQDAYPALLARKWTQAGVALRPRNAGVSGATSAGILESIDWNLADDVHTLFLAIGANDGLRGHDLSHTRANISRVVRRAKAVGIRVILAGMRIPSNYGADYTQGFAKIYPTIANEHNVPLMPFLLEGVGGIPAHNQADRIHPNEKGHRVIAANVHAFLEKQGLLR